MRIWSLVKKDLRKILSFQKSKHLCATMITWTIRCKLYKLLASLSITSTLNFEGKKNGPCTFKCRLYKLLASLLVTSIRAIFKLVTNPRCWNHSCSLGNHSSNSLSKLVQTTMTKLKQSAQRILACHTHHGGNFKSFCEVNQKFQRLLLLFFSIPRHTKGNQAAGQNCARNRCVSRRCKIHTT